MSARIRRRQRRTPVAVDKNGSRPMPDRPVTVPVLVWDPLVRVCHWALALAVALAWATTFATVGGWHDAFGTAALAIVVVRVVWGFIGPRSARFAGFVRSPSATWRYA